MKAIVLGATGFVGRRLVAKLLANNVEVEAWVRDVARANLPPAAVLRAWDMPDAELAAALSGVDAVINLAGAPVMGQRWSKSYRQELRRSRVELTGRLVEICRQADPRPSALVSASAIGIYGDRGDAELTESSSTGDGFLAQLCVDWEQAAEQAAGLGMRVALVRIGIVIGAGGGALQKMLGPFRAGVGGPLGKGAQWMSWIDIDDLVSILERALTDPKMQGAINATAPNPLTNREFSKTLGRALKRPAALRAPRIALKLALGQAAEVLLQSQRVEPAALQALGFEFKCTTLEQSLEAALA